MKKIIVMIIAVLMVATVFMACTQPAAEEPAKEADVAAEEPAAEEPAAEEPAAEGKPVIAIVPQQIGIPYFETSADWAMTAGEDLGVEVIYTGPTTGDAASQANILEDLINKGVDVIAVSPLDSSALVPVMKKAAEAGIIVITWDSDVDDVDAREAFVNVCDWEALGRTLMDKLATEMGETGEYAIITSVLTAQNCSAWAEWATQHQEENYPEMTRVAYEPCDDDQAKAYSITQNLITAYPDLKGILGVTSPAAPAAAQAVREAGKNGEIKIIGLSEPSMTNEFLKDNSMQMSILWHPGKFRISYN